MSVEREIGRVFERAHVSAWLHVVDIDGDGEVAIGADTPVALVSVFKLPVLVALHRAGESGELDLADRIPVPAATRTSGVTGLAALSDDAELSLRDLAQLMITISDNAAADAVVDRVGFGAVARTLDHLGLRATHIGQACRDLHAALAEDLEAAGTSLARAMGDPAVLAGLRVLDPDTTN
ncbi:MAG TPA: serine hydrolase, partial [Acidimicrobiales bacterium]